MSLPEAEPKWLCEICDATTSTVLTAPNPFDPDDIVVGCPNCRSVGTMVQCCQVEGCGRRADSGNPGGYGYRYFHACWRHAPKAGEKP